MDLKKLKEGLSSLITEKTDPKVAELIGQMAHEVDSVEKEHKELLESKEELRKKYVEAVKTSAFKGEPIPEVKDDIHPKSFEDCLAEVEAQRK